MNRCKEKKKNISVQHAYLLIILILQKKQNLLRTGHEITRLRRLGLGFLSCEWITIKRKRRKAVKHTNLLT